MCLRVAKTEVVCEAGEVRIIELSGPMDSKNAGALFDALVVNAEPGSADLIVDLYGVTRATRAGVRGLIVAAKLRQVTGRRTRICGAVAHVAALLKGFGYDHLLKLDPTRADAFAALMSESAERTIALRTYATVPVKRMRSVGTLRRRAFAEMA